VSLEQGRRLGPYEIVSAIGAGGMGEVYEARDTRLGRTVAIKILPEELAGHAERLARFEREARAVSQLSHPHVCTLHDIGEEQGLHFLVMEHCQGETLAERLRRGSIDLPEVLRVGAQIAEALHAAHRQGIVHRDLKPGNIMITGSGAKLLDFGLARMAAEDGGTESSMGSMATLARDPDQPLTAEGTILGTYPYMAPEQIEGAETDGRSDTFALGAVLYEMATGKRAFEGKSAASVMAAVLREHPDPISKVQPISPPALDHVVSRCLAKDPEERWQSARDVAAELRWISEAGSGAGVAAPVARRRRSRERQAWAAAGVLGLLLLTTVAAWLWSHEVIEQPVVRVPIEIPQDASLSGPAISPDGTTVAYSLWREGKGQLVLQPLSRLEPAPVLGATNAERPFFSPDGRWIGYFADRELRKIPVSGGSPITLCAIDSFTGGSWGEDGTIVFSKNAPSGIWAYPGKHDALPPGVSARGSTVRGRRSRRTGRR
jgi:eukaryotic-like serine/threonine-protein kinase